ncbi:hypothetical protein CWI38_1057p0010, partial [Hamiltosporidium tvaerminnensis]
LLSNLQVIQITDSTFIFDNYKIKYIEHLLIQEFFINRCESEKNDEIFEFINSMPNLKSLKLTPNSNISLFKYVFKYNMMKLKNLEKFKIKDENKCDKGYSDSLYLEKIIELEINCLFEQSFLYTLFLNQKLENLEKIHIYNCNIGLKDKNSRRNYTRIQDILFSNTKLFGISFSERYNDQNDQYTWIFNVIDTYTKHLWCFKLINKTSELVRDSLKFLFNNFGVPVAIQSYNGREFKNTLLEAFLTDLNIKIIHGRPHNSKAQGQVERVNQTIKRWLAKKLHETGFNNPLSRSIIVENEASLIVTAIYIDPDIALVEENAERGLDIGLPTLPWKSYSTDVVMGYKKYEKKDQCYNQECVDVIKNRNLASLKALQEKTEKYAQKFRRARTKASHILKEEKNKKDYKIRKIEKMAENKEIRKRYKTIRNEIRDFQARNMMAESTEWFLLTDPKKHLNSKMQREADDIINEKFMKENNDHIEDGETNVLEPKVAETTDGIIGLANNNTPGEDKLTAKPLKYEGDFSENDFYNLIEELWI